MHSDSHINEDIFASATTTGRTSKFNPKPRINIKKALPKSSKSGADEDPSSTSKFPSSEDIKCPVEGSLNASYEFHSSSVALPAHNVLQSPERTADCSVSSNVLDEVPQLDIGESQEIGMGTDVSSHLGSLDGSILTFSTSASTVGGCQLNAISPFESRGSEQPANLDQVVGDSIEVLTNVYGSLLESSSETYPAIKPPRSLEVVPLEFAQNEVNASQAFANFQDTEETITSASLDDSLFDSNARSVGRENKFQPKLRQMIVKCISSSSDAIKTSLEPPCAPEMRSQVGSRLGLSTVVTSVSNTCNFEVHELPESSSFLDSTFIDDNDGNSQMDDGKSGEAPDLFANVETPNVNIKQTSISVLSEPVATHSPIMSEEFAAHQEASYSSEGDANLHIHDKLGEGPTTGRSGLEPLDDMLLQSELPAVKQIGKFRPKSALRVERKKAKSVSFILPNDGESAASAEHQPEMTTSRPIERITSFVEMMSDQNINDGTSSSPNCYKNNQVDLVDSIREDVMGICGLDTLEILSEPILNSDQHVCKSKPDLQAKTKNAKNNAGISPDAISSAPINHGDIESGLSQLDSLSINSESLGAHGPDFPSGDLIESFAQQSYNCISSNFSVEGACLADNSDLGAQSLGENQELQNMEGETMIDVSLNHFEERDVERCTPSIVQDDEAGKSSRRHGLRNRKLKSSVVDDTTSEYQNFENTMIPEMDVENSGNGYQDEDVMKKKKRKATRKLNSTSSEHERSIKSHKKASEEPDSTVKDPPKKRLPHGSRRKSAQRQVNKSLLEIPDDELDRRQLVIRDLIRLAGFKERVSNKEAAAMKNYFTNQTSEDNLPNTTTFKKDGHLNDENFHEVPEQGTTGDDTNEEIQQEAPKLNYHTYMRRPQQTRWSKTDTELFYQAIRQFGSDFAMVQLLFPNRSRLQVKAKFKNEQRKHPLQIADALVYRSKDHSHFEKVIQHLQDVAEQKSKNEASCDPTTESQDVADDNEEERTEANKKEQDPTGFKDAEEWSSLKSNVRDGDDHIPIDLSGYEDCF